MADAACAAVRRFGSGAAASRLMTGTLECHAELERALAAWQSYPAALVFGSGCLTNVGTLPVLLGRGDVAFVDRLAHATILDGVALSRATCRRFRHNDPDDLERRLAEAAAGRRPGNRFLVATESVFSMDGDRAPLRPLVEAAERYEAMLLVDEAHAALGVFGPLGAGLVAAERLGLRRQCLYRHAQQGAGRLRRIRVLLRCGPDAVDPAIADLHLQHGPAAR